MYAWRAIAQAKRHFGPLIPLFFESADETGKAMGKAVIGGILRLHNGQEPLMFNLEEAKAKSTRKRVRKRVQHVRNGAPERCSGKVFSMQGERGAPTSPRSPG